MEFLQFVKVISLHGHEDWIRGLEFATEGKPYNMDYFIKHLIKNLLLNYRLK